MTLPAFRERLARGRLVGDGAMGTMLQQAGLALGASPDAWNLTRPEAVLAVHRAYRAAGAELLQTNTFGATRERLAPFGLADRVAAINRAAVILARDAADGGAYVAGTIGPTGLRFDRDQDLAPIREIFAEQASALVDAGVDLLLIETMSDPREALAAIAAARSVTDLPVLITSTFGRNGSTPTGAKPVPAAAALAAAGADGLGANCGEGPAALYPVIAAMRAAHPDFPLLIQPNAGLPVIRDGALAYDIDPATFAAWARRYAELTHLIGGCCGTTPAHIAAVVEALAADKM